MSGARVHCCSALLRLQQLREEVAVERRQHKAELDVERQARAAAERYAKHCEAQLLRLRIELVGSA